MRTSLHYIIQIISSISSGSLYEYLPCGADQTSHLGTKPRIIISTSQLDIHRDIISLIQSHSTHTLRNNSLTSVFTFSAAATIITRRLTFSPLLPLIAIQNKLVSWNRNACSSSMNGTHCNQSIDPKSYTILNTTYSQILRIILPQFYPNKWAIYYE